MQDQQEQWIDEALDSLRGSPGPAPSPFLYSRLRHRLHTRSGAEDSIPMPRLRTAMAALLLLLSVNLGLLAWFTRPAGTAQAAQEQSYSSLEPDFDLYGNTP